jgi:hypothetical protein
MVLLFYFAINRWSPLCFAILLHSPGGCILTIMSYGRCNINSLNQISAQPNPLLVCVLRPGHVFKSQSACVQDAEQQYRIVKALAVHAMEVYVGVGVWLHLFLTALDGVEWSASAALPLE